MPDDNNHFSNQTELDSIPEYGSGPGDGGNGADFFTSNRTTP